MKHTITVMPQNKSIEVNDGDNLRTALLESDLTIKSPCGGCASCGQCILLKALDHLSEISFEEKQLVGNVVHITGERLSCQARVHGNVSIDITAHKQKSDEPKPIVKRRTREEYDEVIKERIEKRNEKPKKQGGFKRPKSFTPEKEDTHNEE